MFISLQKQMETMPDGDLLEGVEKLEARLEKERALPVDEFVWLTFAKTILAERRYVGVHWVNGTLSYRV
ncbi:MAG: hypothetical protein V4606_04725 [Patescibacteria group bacterium]